MIEISSNNSNQTIYYVLIARQDYLCEVSYLGAQFTLHPVDGALELHQLSIQEAGVVFVFRQLQNNVTWTAKTGSTINHYQGSQCPHPHPVSNSGPSSCGGSATDCTAMPPQSVLGPAQIYSYSVTIVFHVTVIITVSCNGSGVQDTLYLQNTHVPIQILPKR